MTCTCIHTTPHPFSSAPQPLESLFSWRDSALVSLSLASQFRLKTAIIIRCCRCFIIVKPQRPELRFDYTIPHHRDNTHPHTSSTSSWAKGQDTKIRQSNPPPPSPTTKTSHIARSRAALSHPWKPNDNLQRLTPAKRVPTRRITLPAFYEYPVSTLLPALPHLHPSPRRRIDRNSHSPRRSRSLCPLQRINSLTEAHGVAPRISSAQRPCILRITTAPTIPELPTCSKQTAMQITASLRLGCSTIHLRCNRTCSLPRRANSINRCSLRD